jgi:UDP-N-acetylmuramyl pentapeptide phosphotransferase/UDP-N-acetylglucosamine-1-phosphate transferase
MKALILSIWVLLLVILFYVQSNLRKPTFNRLSNMWHEDRVSKAWANIVVICMVIIGAIIGFLLS